MAVSLKFLGGVRTVTGSSHLVNTEKSRILLDAGMFHGRRNEFYSVNTTFTYNPYKITALLLSHAHIDHCGNIPSVIKRGLNCKIYGTSSTKDLAKLMLEDSGKIQEEDVRYVNKINRRLHRPLQQPLYSQKEAQRATKKFRPLSYGQRFCVAKDVFVTLYNAGHILGSSIIVLDIHTNNRRQLRLGYAVDLGRRNLPLLRDPVVPEQLDYLILESTYGGRIRAPISEAKAKLRDAIVRTVERKGKILIPSFALERTQEVLYFLSELLRERLIPGIPIYVDSPLATNITEVFKYHLGDLNEEIHRAVRDGNSPFDFLNLRYVQSQEESKALNSDDRPMIIISSSGMCESGRILHHLQNNVTDSRNTILVVGYMAQDTLGKRIVDKARFIRIFGIERELNAEVVVINAFSAHADQGELVDFVEQCKSVKKVFLVHGDFDQSKALADILTGKGWQVSIPEKNEEVLLV